MSQIIIINSGSGNLLSLKRAIEIYDKKVKVSENYDEILNAKRVFLPGVGAFGDAMITLEEQNLIKTIKDFVQTGKPFMGVCLGLQLLFTNSEEFGNHKGLDIIKGTVKKFDSTKTKVPQIGWNKIYKDFNTWENSPLEDTINNEFMYFVHSYYVIPSNKNVVLTKTNYSGIEYCSSIKKDNILATQFHPEKSGEKGLEIYNNWSKSL